MLSNPLKNIPAWISFFGKADLPVLDRTVRELSMLKANEDKISGREISKVVLHDPFMTIKVIQYLQQHKSKNQNAEITTIEHAIMMLGLNRFFRHFSTFPTIESTLEKFPEALQGLMTVFFRAYHASLYARDWAYQRKDMESEEVVIAALLHDMGEMLLWCFAPSLAIAIRQKMQQNPTMRSKQAQTEILGFALMDLQRELVKAWCLPELLNTLMDDEKEEVARLLNVKQAVMLARHSAHSWGDPAIPSDFVAIKDLLQIPAEDVLRRVRTVGVKVAHEWNWYGIIPSIASTIQMMPITRKKLQ